MSDKYKTVKKILLLCLTCMLICSFFLFQMNTLIALLAAAFFYFSFMSPVGALGDSLAQKTAVNIRIPFGRIRMWGSLGFATTALIGGQILSIIGIENLFYVYLVYGAGAFIICWTISDIKVNNQPVTVFDAIKVGKDPKVFMFLLVIVFITIAHRTNDSFLGLYITELGGTEAQIGWAWFIAVATEALVFATSGLWYQRLHPLTFIFISGVLYVVRWMLFAWIDTPEMILMFQFLHGLNFGLFYLCAFQYVTRLVPDHLQATGQLLLISVFFGFSGIVGSVGGGAIFDYAGGSVLYFWMGILSLLGCICVGAYRLYMIRNGQDIESESY